MSNRLATKDRASAPSGHQSRKRTRPPAPAPRWLTYEVEVAATERLSPSLVRLTFAAEALRGFGVGGHDQRVKLILPQPGRTMADVPRGDTWYDEWRAMPQDIRPTLRTYTVRAVRPANGELDIDFVLHGVDGDGPDDNGVEAGGPAGPAGPAATWAAGAKAGNRVGLVGPDRPGTGRMWGCEWSPPETTRQLLLAGDETAVPAMASIVESLPPEARGIVCAEVPYADDRQAWRTPDGVDVRWLVRADGPDGGDGTSDGGPAVHGALLEAAVAEAMETLCGQRGGDHTPAAADPLGQDDGDVIVWDVPDDASEFETAPWSETGADNLYGWLAGEAGTIKRLRRLLVNEYQVPRTSVAFMGYWRRGHTETD